MSCLLLVTCHLAISCHLAVSRHLFVSVSVTLSGLYCTVLHNGRRFSRLAAKRAACMEAKQAGSGPGKELRRMPGTNSTRRIKRINSFPAAHRLHQVDKVRQAVKQANQSEVTLMMAAQGRNEGRKPQEIQLDILGGGSRQHRLDSCRRPSGRRLC
ncbi:hypothetical protein B0T13DRAFT_529221 [Neurospora crassa]|nr:hypothetical protein B0T13DRAFT_529221 [Neurospora crassa]